MGLNGLEQNYQVQFTSPNSPSPQEKQTSATNLALLLSGSYAQVHFPEQRHEQNCQVRCANERPA